MSDVYRIVTWDELGCPTEPGNIEFDGMTLSIKQLHIDAAKGEPLAAFQVLRIDSHAGVRYVLGVRDDPEDNDDDVT